MTSADNPYMDENYREENPHGAAQSQVGIWMGRHYGFRFVQQDLFTDSQWKSLAEILERFYGLNSVERAMRYRQERRSEDLAREVEAPLYWRHLSMPTENEPVPPRRELPNGPLTILEAAYEHLGNADGMRRLLMYSMLADCLEYRGYLARLRKLCGEDWPAERDRMVDLYEQYGTRERNLAYEYLLAEEQLGKSAWKYLERVFGHENHIDDSSEDTMNDLLADQDGDLRHVFAVAASSGEHDEQLGALLFESLQDADSDLLKFDTPKHRLQIATLMNVCRELLPKPIVQTQRERLGLMYPKRRELQEMLDQVMDGTFNPEDAHWVLPILIEEDTGENEEEEYEEDSLV